MTDPALQGTMELDPATAPAPQYQLIIRPDNDFVETHPRFARANDLLGLRRILGQLRVSQYLDDEVESYAGREADSIITYGIVVVKGDYDPAGVWTQKDDPDPSEKADEDDKWLFKNRVWLSPGSDMPIFKDGKSLGGVLAANAFPAAAAANPDVRMSHQPTRPAILSTDQQLPNGSHIDLKTRRKLEYGERLAIAASLETGMPEGVAQWAIQYDLRMLVRRAFG